MIVNFEEVAAAIVYPQSNTLGQQLASLIPESQNVFKVVQNEACQEDIMSIVSAMPRLVAGYTSLDMTDTTMSSESLVVLEVTNTKITDILSMIVGHISTNALTTDALLSVGVGVDVSKVLPAFEQLTQLIQNTEYKCAPLAMGKMFLPPAPAQLAMVTQFAGSVKGFSASIIDVDVDFSQGPPQLNSFDAVIAVATDDASTLAMMAAANPLVTFDPLDPAGAPSKLNSMFLPPEVELYAAIKNNFLTVYSGDAGEKIVETLSGESLESNALLSFAVNYGKIWAKEELFKNALQMSGAQVCNDASMKDALSMITANRGSGAVQLEINDFGVVFSTDAKMIKSDSKFDVCL